MENLELTHHGILGMKWGRRRYQNKDGSLTAAGKKRYGDGDESKKESDKEAYEAAKQKALKSGSAAEVLKYKGDLTKQEMDSAIQRIRWEQDMNNLASKDVENGQQKVDKIIKGLNKGTEAVTSGFKAYNTVAAVYNAFNGNKKMLPRIDVDNINKGNRKERLQEEKDRKKEAKVEAEERRKAEKASQTRAEQESQRDAKRAERAAKKEAKKAEKEQKNERNSPLLEKWSSYDSFSDLNTPVSNPTPEVRETARLGQTAIAGYLNPPRKEDD